MGLLIRWQGQLDQAVEILEHLRVPLYRCLPVLVDTSLQGCLGRLDLIRMRRSVIVMICVCCDPVQMCGMSLLPPLCEEAEVLQDVILCMSPYPRTEMS